MLPGASADPATWWLRFLIVAVFGLVLGSFTSALSYRVPRGLPWRGGRSACPACHAALTPLDLVPIFSWLVLRGRCRHCGAPIGWRYPAIELAILAGSLLLYVCWGFSAAAFIAMAALPFLLTLLIVDIEQMILPDAMQAALALIGMVFAGALVLASAQPAMVAAGHALACVVYGALIWLTGWVVGRLRRRDSLGFGDVKFMAIAGLWLGLPLLPVFLIVSGLMGVGYGLAWRAAGRGSVFPFGPALILAFYACLLLEGTGFSGLDLLH